MRIAYLSASALPSRAANSVHVMKMCSAMARLGHDVTLLGWRSEEPEQDLYELYGVDRNFKIDLMRRTLRGPAGALQYSLAVRRHLSLAKERQFDVMYARHRYALAMAGQFARAKVLEAHAPPYRLPEKIAETVLFETRGFERLVVISAALRTEYARLFPRLSDAKVCVAHDGADLPADGNVGFGKGRAGAGANPFVVGYIGHLYPGKGMEIIAALAPQLPQFRFVVVGGTDNDLAYWRDRARYQNLTFVGHVPHARLPEYMVGMDIVLAPYQRKVRVSGGVGDVARWMSPLKLFEYMANAKTIIASDLSVLREILTDGRNAILVPPEDLSAWRSAILALADEPAARLRLSHQAYRDFCASFTWDARASRVLRGIVAESRP